MNRHDAARILLVDDRAANLVALEAVLADLGAVLVRAGSGEEALRRVLEADFAAILLDVQMPDMSGFEVVRLLRSRQRSRTTPVLFLTGGETPEFPLTEAYALGAVDYLVKPLVPAILRAKVAFFVDHFHQARQLREAERRNAEAALREQRELWQTTLSSIGDAVIATDAEVRVTFVNGEAERLTGWTRGEAVGRPLDDVFHIVHEQTRARVPCPVRRVLACGQVVGLADRTALVARDGTDRPIDDSAAPIRDEAGKLLGAVLVFRDITEKQAAARRLRESEEHLKSVFDSAAEGLYVMGLDGRCTYLNAAGAAMLGHRPEDLIGLSLHEIIHHKHADGSPFPIDECPIARAAQAGVRARVDDEVFWHRDGSAIPVVYSASPMIVGGAVAGAVVTFSDIRERKRAEAELRAAATANATFRVFFEQGTNFAGVMTLDGTVIEANRLSLDACGFTRDEVIGRPFWECGWWNRSPALMAMIREASRAAAEGRPFRTETPYFLADGSQRWVDLVLAPVTDDAGKVLFVAPTGTDISERKRAEEALRTSEARLRFLDALGEATRATVDPGDVMATTTRLLGEHLAVTRTAYADVDTDSDRFTIRQDWTAAGAASSAGVYSLDLFDPRSVAELRAGRTLVVRDVDAELADSSGAATFRAIGVRAIVCCPLVKRGRLVALMAVHAAAPRDWTAAEVGLVEAVVERSWAHIERVRDAAALRDKDERLQLLASNIKDYAVIVSDRDGVVIDWQGGAERITGFTADEAIGRRADILFTPEDRAAGKPAEEMEKAARDGRAEDRRWHLRRDGARFFADGVMVPLFDGAARLRGFGKVFKDATGEALAEESRRRHTEQLRRLADVASRLAAVLDLDSVLGVLTEEGRALIDARQAIAHIVPDAAATDRGERTGDPRGRAAIFPALAGGSAAVRLTHAQLTAHPAWPAVRAAAEVDPPLRGLLAAPIIGRIGEPLGVIQLSDKRTGEFTEEDEAILAQLAQMAAVAIENTRLYRALRDADRRKDEFLAMLAHELRSPLAPMHNALALLDHRGAQDPTAVRLREILGRQMRHLSRLVDDLLDVARITSGKVALQRETVALARVIAQAVETSRPLLEAREHALIVDITDEPVWLDADPVRLAQVIANLLNNAAKYTDPGGHIRVFARRDGDDAVVRVEDDGIGLSPEMLSRVFDLFTQASAGIDRSAGGLGIGLTLVRALVELHGGNVRATSRGPGHGSEFAVRLPTTAAPSTPAAAPPAPPTAGKRVLVVDDNPDTLESLALLLELGGHTVATAPDGVAAVEVARAFRPEVMFLDLGLPGRDGYEVARILRDEFPRGVLRLVALSGYGQAEDRRRTREAGFDQHLVKPVDQATLTQALLGRTSAA